MRTQSIKCKSNGTPYVTHKGRRINLEEFMRITPIEINGVEFHGAAATCAWGGYLISIDDGGDTARVIEQYS